MTITPEPWAFHFSGGSLGLDFANTVSWRGRPQPIERLATFGDLLAWGRQAGLLAEPDGDRLGELAERRPVAVRRTTLERAVRLRDLLYRLFADLVGGGAPRSSDLDQLNAVLGATLGRVRVEGAFAPFRLGWAIEPDRLDALLGPVVMAAADLLVSPDLGFLRTCAAPECGWIFIDRSRTRQRRWCDMRVCGNRSKARRFYSRHHIHQSPDAGASV